MSISSLRWRAPSALIAAGAAAAAVLALTVPAGAVTGTAEISPEEAGYTATGAQFQTITATVFLRMENQYAGEVANIENSVQLWSAGLVVTLGVTANTIGGGWVTFATIYDRSTHAVIASNPNAVFCTADEDCSAGPYSFFEGYPLTLKISYSTASGQLSMSELSSEGSSFTASYTATGQSFTQARAGTEFGSSPWDNSYSYTPPAQPVKAAAYTSVALTSYSGHTATLWSWWTHHKLEANTEQQSSSDWVAVPNDLSNGGASFSTYLVPQSAQSPSQPAAP